MNLHLDESLAAFREEIRKAIAQDLPADMRDRQIGFGGQQSEYNDMLAWMRILGQRGWNTPHWPVEFGGKGWTPLQRFVFEDELAAAYAPTLSLAGPHMVGPVVYTFGSDHLKDKFLPAIRRGDYLWAQGFSEPSNGSDLANLRTSAILKGDTYIVKGQKIWTTGANVSEWGFFLVRTDPTVKPQRGLSMILIHMKSPGITVRLIPQINSEEDVCEVFLDDVEVPANQLIGEPGAGWSYAKFLLDNERTASSYIYFNKRELRRAQAIARAETLDGVPLAELPAFQGRLARLEAEVAALEWSVLRTLAKETYRYDETAVASTLKIVGSSLQQAITELQADLIGAKAIRFFEPEASKRTPEPLWPEHVPGRTSAALSLRAATIYGGTMQIQKNLIAKLAFGL